MLTKFATKNYRGFSERIEFDLSSPSNYEFSQHAIRNGIIKNGIVYGANGSGKTNLGLAIFDIVNHLTQKFKKAEYYSNFAYAGAVNQLVDFEYTFTFDNQVVKYAYSKAKNGTLINEELYVNDMFIFKKQKKSFDIDTKLFPIDIATQTDIANNANGLSIINFLLSSYPLSADHYLMKLKSFVDGMLWFRNVDVREFIGLETGVTILDEFIIRKRLWNDFKDFLDTVSGQEFDFVEPQRGEKMLYCRYGNNKVPFCDIASTGTRALHLLYVWLQKMNEATFVFIDEFDAFYHFALSYEVCKRLFGLDCQVFLSSHNTYLMTNELLRPDCNFILHKNKIKPLCDCTDKELRFAHNMEKLYRGGTFAL